jgi:hypothetical protein
MRLGCCCCCYSCSSCSSCCWPQVDMVRARELIESKVEPAMRKWKLDLTQIVHGINGLDRDTTGAAPAHSRL